MVAVKLLRFSKGWGYGGDGVSNNDNNNDKDYIGMVVMIVII
jgi:hypothetical protein